ncbi:hypothetical protein JIR001_15020 [Polycladomyces abyssicola]|uniref:Uncharacterized protein n=1 Tax=Polycladomyces abyssicola TaxID=1125966 RepID=A0A8D5ZKQ6_9BACL|nr:hypothetical protein JIR001_15020 [Polycladomyces abyssicola]
MFIEPMLAHQSDRPFDKAWELPDRLTIEPFLWKTHTRTKATLCGLKMNERLPNHETVISQSKSGW